MWWTGDWDWRNGRYLLIHRLRKEAIFPALDVPTRVYDDNWLFGIDTYLAVGRRYLDVSADQGPDGPAIDAAWLSQAELVRVQSVSLGVFTKPLKVDNFVLPPLR